MARPPRRQVAKRPAPVRDLSQSVVAAEEGGASAGGVGDPGSDDALREKLISEFQAALSGNPDLGDKGLEELMEFFRSAVEEVSLDAPLTIPDSESWTQTLNSMVDGGLLTEGDRNDLARQFEEANRPLQSKEVRVAFEYSRRVRSEGEEKALEWLHTECAREDENADPAVVPGSVVVAPLRQSITRSRSRRLRGPP